MDLKAYMQFIKFALVGASNSAVYLAVYYAFIWVSDAIVIAMTAQALAWALSVGNSFVWNRKFVFEDSQEVWWRALGKTFAGYSSCFLVSSLLTFIQIELLGVPAAVVPLVNLPIMGPINFVILKYWALRDRGQEEPQSAVS
jgi:putative flippase GtrA